MATPLSAVDALAAVETQAAVLYLLQSLVGSKCESAKRHSGVDAPEDGRKLIRG